MNTVESINSYFNLFDTPSYEGEFIQPYKFQSSTIPFKGKRLYQVSFTLDGDVVENQRQIYGMIDAISDLGGVMDIFKKLLAFIIVPIS